MKKLSTLLTCIFILCVAKSNAATALNDSMKLELQRVSNIMYHDTDNNFIVVDAIIDGLIPLDEFYELGYKNGEVEINYAPLPTDKAVAYAKKISKFLVRNGSKDSSAFSMRCDGTKLADIFDTASTFRKTWVHDIHIAMDPNLLFNTKPILELLISDNVIDSANYDIVYNLHGLFINNIKLSSSKAAKYIKLINAQGYSPEKGGDEMELENGPQKHKQKNDEKDLPNGVRAIFRS